MLRFSRFARCHGLEQLSALNAKSIAAAGTKHAELQLVECPRDAIQGLRDFVATENKIRYINALLRVGFHTLDCGSFVSAPAVPQMRDTAEVLAGLDMSNTRSKLLVVTANPKGAIMACKEKKLTYIGYPLSVSETFQRSNTKRDIKTALADLAEIANLCNKYDKKLVTYISMAFGNHYGEKHSIDAVDSLVEQVATMGCDIISLADTVGVSNADIINKTYTRIIPKYPDVRIGGHFHSGTTTSVDKITAALGAGCRRIEGAIGGMGGCPFAKSTLIGNVPTEAIVDTLNANGITHGLDLEQLKKCAAIKHEIFGVAVKELLLATVLNNEKEFRLLVQTHFDRHDRRGDGYLQKPEFQESMQEVFAELGETAPSQERMDKAFKKVDVMNNGIITLDEYMLGARKMLSKRLKEILERDKNIEVNQSHSTDAH